MIDMTPAWIRANGRPVSVFYDDEGDPLTAELWYVDETAVLLYLPESDDDEDAVFTIDPEGERLVQECEQEAPVARLCLVDSFEPITVGGVIAVWAAADGEGGCVLVLGTTFFTVASMGADRKL